jgi:hypothetical protein
MGSLGRQPVAGARPAEPEIAERLLNPPGCPRGQVGTLAASAADLEGLEQQLALADAGGEPVVGWLAHSMLPFQLLARADKRQGRAPGGAGGPAEATRTALEQHHAQ